MTRTFEDALLDAVQRVKKAGTAYAISGGVAKALYGAPAFTKTWMSWPWMPGRWSTRCGPSSASSPRIRAPKRTRT